MDFLPGKNNMSAAPQSPTIFEDSTFAPADLPISPHRAATLKYMAAHSSPSPQRRSPPRRRSLWLEILEDLCCCNDDGTLDDIPASSAGVLPRLKIDD